ncbi:hypothetical protein GWN26_08015 [Candidatus Saccharibacteria bacterium]|nr:hypothetical protein [Candidatus Saccharibacteria bacterium]NIV03839.1 hypothetical protein [Calditrichia bacterium]NIS38398.1 hypothetical protein [Candidatus Saccharibacteria bacterium]NIV72174.1 hypothetical protein [Calditrichia bacterium]NIV99087.1 hypothetical protein [Candidatus Saccharibacteria bacterium]
MEFNNFNIEEVSNAEKKEEDAQAHVQAASLSSQGDQNEGLAQEKGAQPDREGEESLVLRPVYRSSKSVGRLQDFFLSAKLKAYGKSFIIIFRRVGFIACIQDFAGAEC